MDIRRIAEDIIGSDLNRVNPENALIPEIAGKQIFDMPIFGYGNPANPYFEGLRNLEDLRIKPPSEWLSSVKTVISVFFPYSSEMKESNKTKKDRPSYEWLHVRIDGQTLIGKFLRDVENKLRAEGFDAIAPTLDPRFIATSFSRPSPGIPNHSSNWSERHAAYACGLGTFSLTKALITKKGSAGRLGSILTSVEMDFTKHTYKGLYDNCMKCGACIHRCPVSAISESGKDNTKCAAYLASILDRYEPYYGCGECQVRVPCENGIPKRNAK